MILLTLSIFIISLWIAIFALIELRKLRKQYRETVKKVATICEKLPVPEALYAEGHTFEHVDEYFSGLRYQIVRDTYKVIRLYYEAQDLVWKYVVLDQRNNAKVVDEDFVKKHSSKITVNRIFYGHTASNQNTNYPPIPPVKRTCDESTD